MNFFNPKSSWIFTINFILLFIRFIYVVNFSVSDYVMPVIEKVKVLPIIEIYLKLVLPIITL